MSCTQLDTGMSCFWYPNVFLAWKGRNTIGTAHKWLKCMKTVKFDHKQVMWNQPSTKFIINKPLHRLSDRFVPSTNIFLNIYIYIYICVCVYNMSMSMCKASKTSVKHVNNCRQFHAHSKDVAGWSSACRIFFRPIEPEFRRVQTLKDSLNQPFKEKDLGKRIKSLLHHWSASAPFALCHPSHAAHNQKLNNMFYCYTI